MSARSMPIPLTQRTLRKENITLYNQIPSSMQPCTGQTTPDEMTPDELVPLFQTRHRTGDLNVAWSLPPTGLLQKPKLHS